MEIESALVTNPIGPIAKLKDIRFGENLPKTLSGRVKAWTPSPIFRFGDLIQFRKQKDGDSILRRRLRR
jgi:hypothetical protein